MTAPVRIGNASGFYGDRFSAVREMLTGGPLDVLTGDYLAELTMLILGRDRMKDPNRGYAKTFLRQLEENLALAKEKGVKIVANAGGLNPAGLAGALRELAVKLGVDVSIAHVEGDDLIARSGELGFGKPLTANAYLGAWGIVDCLNAGADIVVTGRVTDASVIVGPAAAHFGWARDDYDALAGAVAAGHVIECGTQATGGNYAFFTEHHLGTPGFPIAEIHADGSSVITKHEGTGGVVTVGTVTAQLLYEITGARYAGPDVTTRFDTLTLAQDGPDRVRLSGATGEPPPPTLKVCLNSLGGFRNETTFVLTGLDIEQKAALVREQLEGALKANPPAEVKWTLARTDHADADTEQQASALLHVAVKDADQNVAGRGFSSAAIELALGSYPGFHVTAPPSSASPYGVYTAAYVDAGEVPHIAVLSDGSRVDIAPASQTRELSEVDEPELPEPLASGAVRRAPLGKVVGARSGDKGSNANVGVWVRSGEAWCWLAHRLTVAEFKLLLPETAELVVKRYLLPELWAMNFVVEGILGEGVSSQARFDPQAKAVGEWLRSREIDIPEALLQLGGPGGLAPRLGSGARPQEVQ
ncbi:acyclic terpene utilization AtuA family protein [Amycolatopsis sp. H20-H5]|uniref:acyclic terpene utilization AtuA family protein n=1 Tax=Amycolatopsis sp. H20-H5 TaxID=3046309 RepID=UPI002DBEC244|nr:acyclic terpene utilization AtuA family protein [Amycolatopsis sp. H20-H5]MEC3976129.1 acyclic terpene utilization AtuA family protein [Amycolatopsis sp. H20-H5]